MAKSAAFEGEFAIEAEGLRKTYSDGVVFRRRFEALKGISLRVRRGEIFGLLGPNGAGKTTFLKILLGVIRKSGGSASLLGRPAGSREARRFVGNLPEQLRIPRHLTGYGALDFYGRLSDVPRRVICQRRDELLELVGLRDRARDGVRKYSKGMQQRLGLAQAMLHHPALLVMDEPTDGLDPRARADVRGIIRQLRDRGVTVFLNSHILQEVELVCDHVAILNRGHLLYSGPVAEIGRYVASLVGGSVGVQVEFLLRGEPAVVQQCLAEAGGSAPAITAQANGQVHAQVTFDDQPHIDRAIDALRGRDISICSVAPRQLSLEDAFLRIVEQDQRQAPQDKPHR